MCPTGKPIIVLQNTLSFVAHITKPITFNLALKIQLTNLTQFLGGKDALQSQ